MTIRAHTPPDRVAWRPRQGARRSPAPEALLLSFLLAVLAIVAAVATIAAGVWDLVLVVGAVMLAAGALVALVFSYLRDEDGER